MKHLQASSISEVLKHVRAISEEWAPDPSDSEELWFRGQSKSRYKLTPGLYRDSNREFNYDEVSLFERFKLRAAWLAGPHVREEWDWYFLAQHHGLPTRLLDWSENLLAAIYFAVEGLIDQSNRRKYDEKRVDPPRQPQFDSDSPSIWILDAGSLNAFACEPSDDYPFAVGGPLTAKYLPEAIQKESEYNRFPIAILPPHTNERLVAQLGAFTVHGHEQTSIEDFASQAKSGVKLARINLDTAAVAWFWRDLEMMGVNRASLFPDLDSVAMVTKWFSQQKQIGGSDGKGTRNQSSKAK